MKVSSVNVREAEPPRMKARGADFHQVGRDALENLELPEPGGEVPAETDLTVFEAEKPPADPLFKFHPDLVSPPPSEADEYAEVFGGENVRTGSQWHLLLKKKK